MTAERNETGRVTGTPRESAGSSLFGLTEVALAGVIWGSIAIFVRMVDASPLVTAFWRKLIPSLVLLFYLAVCGRLGELSRFVRSKALALCILSTMAVANTVFMFWAFTLTQVAVVVFISYTGPVFVAVLAPLVMHERFDSRILLPLGLALAGTAVLVGFEGFSLSGDRAYAAAAMALCVALTYTGLLLGAKRLLASATPAIVMCSENLIATILLIPVVVLLPFPAGLRSWLAVLIIGFVHTLLPVLLYFSGLRRVRADRVAVIMYSEPVSAVFFAALFLSEPLTVAKALGGAAIVGAGIFVSILEKRPCRDHSKHCETGWANGA